LKPLTPRLGMGCLDSHGGWTSGLINAGTYGMSCASKHCSLKRNARTSTAYRWRSLGVYWIYAPTVDKEDCDVFCELQIITQNKLHRQRNGVLCCK
jgi:hypothetical protein